MTKRSTSLANRKEARGPAPASAVRPRLSLADEPATRPFLKWAGGKTRLLQSILPYVPERFRNYHEPFLGGGAMFFAVRDRARGECHLADLNAELVNTWQVVRDRRAQLLTALRHYEGKNEEADYLAVRDLSPRGRIVRAARFIYLNQTSWNGLWRVNRWGVYNVPWGARPFRGIDAAQLRRVSASLQDVGIVEEDFRVSLTRARAGDFVYLDPPYLPISDTSKFHGYTEKRFRATDLA
jgi:DNA adenine methylase